MENKDDDDDEENGVVSHKYMGVNVVLRHLSEHCISWLL